jgi:hypothetical protein
MNKSSFVLKFQFQKEKYTATITAIDGYYQMRFTKINKGIPVQVPIDKQSPWFAHFLKRVTYEYGVSVAEALRSYKQKVPDQS